MLLLDSIGQLPERLPLAAGPEPLPCSAGSNGRIHDRLGIIQPEPEAKALRCGCRQGPGFMQVQQWHSGQFRQPATQKQPLRVVVLALLDRVVDADRVDAGGAALHLALAPVDAGLVVEKEASQVQARGAPWQLQVMARHRHQHGPHAEIDPAGGNQGTHAGINERQARAPLAPGNQPIGIGAARVDGSERVQFSELQIWLTLKLLNEVTVPMQPLLETPQGTWPFSPLHCRQGAQGGTAAPAGLHHLPQRERAPGQMGRKPRTAVKGGDGAGELAVVAGAALLQKTLQQRECVPAAATLTSGTGVRRQRKIGGRGDRTRIEALQVGQRYWGRSHRLGHPRFPTAGPAIAAGQPADHTELGNLLPGDAVLASPGGNAPVAGVGPAIAGFLMAPQPGHTELPAGPLQHLLHRTNPHHQGLTKPRQLRTQLHDAFGAEGPVPGGSIGLLPELRFHHQQRQHRPEAAGLQQRLVVGRAQVALEPDDLQRAHGGGT